MSKRDQILSYIQILVMVCLMVCNGEIAVNNSRKSDSFPCKGHQCGCKSESDCKTHCCCAPYENHHEFQTNRQEQKNGFRAFMSSVNCKYGNNPLTSIIVAVKYILEDKIHLKKEAFLCFLFSDASIFIPEVIVSPPEKPPRLST